MGSLSEEAVYKLNVVVHFQFLLGVDRSSLSYRLFAKTHNVYQLNFKNLPSESQDLVKFFANDLIEKYKDSLTNKLLEEHKKDKCLIVSGSLTLLVKEISKLLDIENFFGTEAEIKKDLYTGRVKGVPNFSEEKVRRVKEWLIIKDLKFRDIYAYSDSIYDLPLLKYSNRARAVNPDNQLREISAKKGWEVIERAT